LKKNFSRPPKQSLNYIHLLLPRSQNAMPKRYGGSQVGRPSKYRRHNPSYGGNLSSYIPHIVGGVAKLLGSSGGVAEKAQNEDTRINLNDTYNSTSLYSKTTRKRKRRVTAPKKRAAKKKRAFTKKVKRVLLTRKPWSCYSINFTNALTILGAPNTSFGSQDIFGVGYSQALMLCADAGNDNGATPKDINRIITKLRLMGHVENNAIVSGVDRNLDLIKFDYKARMDFDIQCFNVEFTNTNPLYIDIYECVAARNIQTIDHATPADSWIECLAQNNQPFAGDSATVATRKGQRPGDCPTFKKYWSISKVTRVRIASPAPFHYDMTSSGTWDSIHENDFNGQPFARSGRTVGIMIVVAPIMVTTMPAIYNFQITGINRTYKFKQYDGTGKVVNPGLVLSNVATTV